MTWHAAPSVRTRWLVALAIGAASAALAIIRFLRFPGHAPDFVQVWFGARAMLQDANPYALIGPGLEFDWPWPLYYPATAMVAAMPLAVFPATVAFALFVGLSGALLAFAVSEQGWHRLWVLFSPPYFVAVWAAQWSPILSAAMILPPLAILWAAKPNLGAAMFVATGSGRTQAYALGGGAVLVALSLALDPSWPAEWFRTLGANIQRAPITRLGGPLILLALLRWRRPEARLIVALACVPQTAFWYEAVPLLLVPQTRREVQAFVLAVSSGVIVARMTVGPLEQVEFGRQLGALIVAFAYLPAVFIVMRRPNEGPLAPAHRSVERLAFSFRRLFAR